MMKIKRSLQPTDFADSEVRLSDWHYDDFYGCKAVRVWQCKCTNHWFQRHEWMPKTGNETKMDEWIYSGYYRDKEFRSHMKPVNIEDFE